ncbi:MAG: sugar phosphate isomerase/epimerase [Steroidobacteraceae bacterium]
MSSQFNRREFGTLALATLPVAAGFSARVLFAQGAAPGRPDSRFGGVQIGAISGSFGTLPVDQLIPSLLKVGLSEVALTSGHAEALAGAPAGAGGGGTPAAEPPQLNAHGLLPRCADMQMVLPFSTTGGEGNRVAGPPSTPEQQAAQQAQARRLQDWRNATTPATWRAVRKKFTDAGIDLRVLWYGLGFGGNPPTDETIEYAFTMARGLGVKTMSGSSMLNIAPRIAAAADRHKMVWAGHTQDNIHNPDQFATPEAYEKLLALSPYLGICLDVGYFTAAGYDSVAFIQKHHARITDIHLKDRKRSKSLGGDVTNNLLNNWPWGQGDAPLSEVLQLLKKEKWDIPVQIEYDYGCRTTSDAVTEVRRCLDYCRAALA